MPNGIQKCFPCTSLSFCFCFFSCFFFLWWWGGAQLEPLVARWSWKIGGYKISGSATTCFGCKNDCQEKLSWQLFSLLTKNIYKKPKAVHAVYSSLLNDSYICDWWLFTYWLVSLLFQPVKVLSTVPRLCFKIMFRYHYMKQNNQSNNYRMSIFCHSKHITMQTKCEGNGRTHLDVS